MINGFILVAAMTAAFNGFIWSGKGALNATMKLLFITIAFWGAVAVAKVFLV